MMEIKSECRVRPMKKQLNNDDYNNIQKIRYTYILIIYIYTYIYYILIIYLYTYYYCYSYHVHMHMASLGSNMFSTDPIPRHSVYSMQANIDLNLRSHIHAT